jgi:hypothetical protein
LIKRIYLNKFILYFIIISLKVEKVGARRWKILPDWGEGA